MDATSSQSIPPRKTDYIQWPEPEKLLLVAVPYLLLTSYLYYAGYWGTLRIDIYPYLELQDIINGTAYALQLPLISVALCAGSIIAMNVVLALVLRFIRIPELAIAAMLLVGVGVIVLLCHDILIPAYHFLRDEPYTEPEYALFPSWTVPSPVVALLIVFLVYIPQWWFHGRYADFFKFDWVENEQGKERVKVTQGVDFWPHLRDYTGLFSLLAIPALAYPTGYYNAKNILLGKKCEIITVEQYNDNGLLKSYRYLKYLGHAGDSYFLLTPDNKRRVVMSADSLGTLVLSDVQDLLPSKQQVPTLTKLILSH